MDQLAEGAIAIEVACATPELQHVIALAVAPGTTVRDAVRLSAIASSFPALDIDRCQLGIWGSVAGDSVKVAEGDRVEIYRALINDPRAARKRLAAEGQTMGTSGR